LEQAKSLEAAKESQDISSVDKQLQTVTSNNLILLVTVEKTDHKHISQ